MRKIDPWDRDFGECLKTARKGAGKTAVAMAKELGVEKSLYYKYEKGSRSFPKDLLVKVVEITKHGPWFLLTGQPDRECPAYDMSDTDRFRKLPTPRATQ